MLLENCAIFSGEGSDVVVQALIQAAGQGSRLGLGPKAFVILDGKTLLERATELLRDVVDSIVVAVPETGIARAKALVAGSNVTIISGGESRSETTYKLVAVATAPWLVLHDVVHPFATAGLVRSLLEAAYRHGASAPGVPNTEFLYTVEGDLLHAPGETLVGQKPVAFAREAVQASYAAFRASAGSPDPSFLEILERAGLRTKFVEGSVRNIKITSAVDLQFAEAMIDLEKKRGAIGKGFAT